MLRLGDSLVWVLSLPQRVIDKKGNKEGAGE